MANAISNPKSGVQAMKSVINNPAMISRMQNILGDNAQTFLASALDLYSSDTNLSKCDANAVMAECMKAAVLKLPITKSLGLAYIIPYGGVPQFQLGYRSFIQLAQRSGQYRYINADAVYEGETVNYDRVTGMLTIEGQATSDKAVGYFAYFELMNGFRKSVYWTRAKVEAHAKKFSKAWSKADSPWHTQFDAMAKKTVLKDILSKYGILSVEMQGITKALEYDTEDAIGSQSEAEVQQNANKEAITIPAEEAMTEPSETPEMSVEHNETAEQMKLEPDF